MRNLQMPLGRRFRSLKLWFVLRSYGLKGFREHLRKDVKLADRFEQELRNDPKFELVAPPAFALRVFRIRNEAASGTLSASQLDELNQLFWEQIQTRSAELLLTQTVLPQVGFCIRFVTGSPWTQESHVVQAHKVLSECADLTLKQWSEKSQR